jgi:DNA topoisomerase-1
VATATALDLLAPEDDVPLDPVEAAESAGLAYVVDVEPGITRRRRGRGFSYHRPSGDLVRDAATLERIRNLAVPPAWTDVWICTAPLGHLQATGRDAKRPSRGERATLGVLAD